MRGPVVDEDADDVHVSPPGGQVQREATFAVGHVRGRFELEQLEHHFPERDRDVQTHTDPYINRSKDGGMEKGEKRKSISSSAVTFPLRTYFDLAAEALPNQTPSHIYTSVLTLLEQALGLIWVSVSVQGPQQAARAGDQTTDPPISRGPARLYLVRHSHPGGEMSLCCLSHHMSANLPKKKRKKTKKQFLLVKFCIIYHQHPQRHAVFFFNETQRLDETEKRE